jgi:hypothetical protein
MPTALGRFGWACPIRHGHAEPWPWHPTHSFSRDAVLSAELEHGRIDAVRPWRPAFAGADSETAAIIFCPYALRPLRALRRLHCLRGSRNQRTFRLDSRIRPLAVRALWPTSSGSRPNGTLICRRCSRPHFCSQATGRPSGSPAKRNLHETNRSERDRCCPRMPFQAGTGHEPLTTS